METAKKTMLSKRRWLMLFVLSFTAFFAVNEYKMYDLSERFWWVTRPRHNIAFENVATIEQYLFYIDHYPVLIVGSSALTQMPIETMVQPWFHTMCLQGGSALTGMEAVLRSGAKPKLLLVEMETTLRGIDQPMIDRIFDRFYYPLRRNFYSLRPNYNWTNLDIKHRMGVVTLMPKQTETQAQWEEKIAARVVPTAQSYGRIDAIPLEEQKRALAKITSQIQQLTERGIEIVFFHTPYDRRIAETVFFRHWVKSVRAAAPGIRVIPMPSFQQLPLYTEDGTHLFPSSANDYLNYVLHAAGAERFVPEGMHMPASAI